MSDPLELYVYSPAFDKECAMHSKGIGRDGSDSESSSDHNSLWEKDSSLVPTTFYDKT